MEYSLAGYFTTEFIVRIWSLGADAKYSGFSGIVRYFKRLVCLMDVVILAVTFFIIFANNGSFETATLEKVRFLQILRLFHIDRQMTTWAMLKKMISRSFEELVTLYWIAGLVFLFLAFSVYEIETYTEAERMARNESVVPTFQNYGESFWFSVITVMTVGYGDIVPKHWMSKLTVGVLCFFGVVMFAAASSLVGVGMTLMVENEAKMQQATKIRHLAAKVIQTWYRFHLMSDHVKFGDFHQFRKLCNDLHHVEERMKSARLMAKKAAIKKQERTKKLAMSLKRHASFQEKHSETYKKTVTELSRAAFFQTSPLLGIAVQNGSPRVSELMPTPERQRNPMLFNVNRKNSTAADLPPRHPVFRRSSAISLQPRVLQHLQSLSAAPVNLSTMISPQVSRDNEPLMHTCPSEGSLASAEFSDEEKLLDYYYDPYNGDNGSLSRRSIDTTISVLDDETRNRYRQILRMLHYFMFQSTKKKFHRARKPYELMDAENELIEMEHQRMQKIKELELRVQATVGKPTISPFETAEREGQKQNVEDRLILCEEMLKKLEYKAKIINDLGALIMDTIQLAPRARPDPRKRLNSASRDDKTREPDIVEDSLHQKVRAEQKRRVLFKEHSFG